MPRDIVDETTRRRPERQRAAEKPWLIWRLFGPGGIDTSPLPHELQLGATPVGRAAPGGLGFPDDSQMSRTHATLLRESGAETVHFIDQSKNGSSVNGAPTREAELRDGDVVRTGDSIWMVRRAGLGDDGEVPGMLGRSPAMREVRATVGLVARTPATVLILGESGTGKEIVARAIHSMSGRHGPLVTVNASAIPESLAESELFGHTAGAFTGARGPSPGLFRESDRGTLVLDEVGDLPVAIQPKLLRVLEDRVVRPLGGTATVAIDVRVVASTNQELAAQVGDGRFRGDLYARLAEITVHLPPLRERREDVLMLFLHGLGRPSVRMTPDLAEALVLYDWPFNVRELLKVAVEVGVRGAGREPYALALIAGRLAGPRAPSLAQRARMAADTPVAITRADSATGPIEAEDGGIPTREELEALLRRHAGSISAIARERNRSRKQIYRWIEQHGLDLEAYR